MDGAQLKAVRLAGLKLLAARALTEKELRRKLSGKGFAPEEIDAVASEFRSKRMLDDSGIADDVIEYSANRKFEGRTQIRSRLLRRGIDADEAEQKLRENYSPEAEYIAALEFARKKQRTVSNQPLQVQRRRIGSALERRGFPSGIIIKVLSEIQSSKEDNDSIDDL